MEEKDVAELARIFSSRFGKAIYVALLKPDVLRLDCYEGVLYSKEHDFIMELISRVHGS